MKSLFKMTLPELRDELDAIHGRMRAAQDYTDEMIRLVGRKKLVVLLISKQEGIK